MLPHTNCMSTCTAHVCNGWVVYAAHDVEHATPFRKLYITCIVKSQTKNISTQLRRYMLLHITPQPRRTLTPEFLYAVYGYVLYLL